jgi:hypothetical protein
MWAIYTKILAVSTTILIFHPNIVVFQQICWQILHFSPNPLLLTLTLHVMPAHAGIHRWQRKWIPASLPREGVGRE